MRTHPAAEGVQEWCGYALGRLAESEEHHRAAIAAAGGTVDDGAKCHFTIVMFVGSVGYRKPWWLYRLQADSAVERDTWLGCIRGGMALYHEHGTWALRSRERGVHALRHRHGAGTGIRVRGGI